MTRTTILLLTNFTTFLSALKLRVMGLTSCPNSFPLPLYRIGNTFLTISVVTHATIMYNYLIPPTVGVKRRSIFHLGYFLVSHSFPFRLFRNSSRIQLFSSSTFTSFISLFILGYAPSIHLCVNFFQNLYYFWRFIFSLIHFSPNLSAFVGLFAS